jgi:hypothetical protein
MMADRLGPPARKHVLRTCELWAEAQRRRAGENGWSYHWEVWLPEQSKAGEEPPTAEIAVRSQRASCPAERASDGVFTDGARAEPTMLGRARPLGFREVLHRVASMVSAVPIRSAYPNGITQHGGNS